MSVRLPAATADLRTSGAFWDDRMCEPWIDEFYGGSGYFNFGIGPAERPQADACRALVSRLLDEAGAAPDRALDVACGNGASSAAILERFPRARVVGINASHEQLLRASARCDRASFVLMDAARPGIRTGVADLIVVVEAAFSFHTRAAFLLEARRALRPGGRLVLSDILLTRVGTRYAPEVAPGNFVESPAEYRARLADAGFTDVRVVDAIDETWRTFAARKRAFHDRLLADGRMDRSTHAKANARLEIWNTHIRHYLLASAAA